MTRAQNNLWKAIILFAGLGVITLCYVILGGNEPLTPEKKFLWINIYILYASFFFPTFMVSFGKGKEDAAKVVSFNVFFTYLIVVESVTILMTVLVLKYIIQLKYAIVIEAIVLFLGLIGVYLSLMTSSHIDAVEEKYETKLSQIKTIRSMMENINVKANSIPQDFSIERKKITTINEGLKYLAPSTSPVAIDVEMKIVSKMAELDSAIDILTSGGDGIALKGCVFQLEMLLNQRKLVRS